MTSVPVTGRTHSARFAPIEPDGLGHRLFTLALVVVVMLAPGAVGAAERAAGTPSEVVFLAQIVVLLVCGRLLGEAMLRIGQPQVMGQLIAGILLGPSVLGALLPDLQHALFPRNPEQKGMIDAVSQLGILMLLLLTGMQTDLSLVRKLARPALSVSITGIALPFVCGFALGELLPDAMLPKPDQRLITSLFLGVALSISSVKIVAMVVAEMNFLRRMLGQVIVSSAIIDDTIGWIIMSVIFGLALHGGVDPGSLARSVLGTALFLVVSFSLGRRAVFLLIRWVNDHLVSDVPVITAILVVMSVMALITHAIGVHTVLGAFVAGILVGQSSILTRHIDEQLRGLIVALFMPVFFGLAGLSTDLRVLADPSMALLSLGLIAIASIGKFSGAFLGAALGGLTWREAFALGCGMNARGSTEVIVASIGLSMGALSQNLFTMIVAMAVVTTMAMPPMLRWALARVPLKPEESARLEREAVEARGFVPKLERLLVAVDESVNARFASRLAGQLAGARDIPITILEVASGAARRDPSPTRAGPAETYDLLIVGVAPSVSGSGELDPTVARLTAGFDGPLAIADARGTHRKDPIRGALDILVPVTGSARSRRGAEVALELARTGNGQVTALYVAAAAPRKRTWRPRIGPTHEAAILREIVELADQLGVPLRTVVRRSGAVEDAILRQLRHGKHTMIVMGVSPRPGATLFFGDVPAAILRRSERSILLVST
jgi:Kef-type K+ transport system membrane component KefB/nucleotide-binding universal stress UspA family protein